MDNPSNQSFSGAIAPTDSDQLSIANMLRRCEDMKIPFLSSHTISMPPRSQSYFYYIRTTMFPDYKLLSFTTLLCIACIAVFITSCVLGFKKDGQLLEVEVGTLTALKCNQPLKVYQGEVYRTITAVLLSQTLQQMLLDVGCILFVVSRFEHSFGWPRTALIYFLTSLCGNFFFGIICQDPRSDISCGAAISLFGMLGALFGYILINCAVIKQLFNVHKKRVVMGLLEVAGAALVPLLGTARIDPGSFVFSLIAGILASGLIPPSNDQAGHALLRRMGIGLFFLQIIAVTAIFLLAHPKLVPGDKY